MLLGTLYLHLIHWLQGESPRRVMGRRRIAWPFWRRLQSVDPPSPPGSLSRPQHSWRSRKCDHTAVLWIRIRIDCGHRGSGSKRQKWLAKIEKVDKFRSVGCSLLRAECLSCSLDFLYGGLGISKLQYLINPKILIFSWCKFFSKFSHQNPGSGSGFAMT